MPTPSFPSLSPIETPCHPMVTGQDGYPLFATYEGAKGLSSQTHSKILSPLGQRGRSCQPPGTPCHFTKQSFKPPHHDCHPMGGTGQEPLPSPVRTRCHSTARGDNQSPPALQ